MLSEGLHLLPTFVSFAVCAGFVLWMRQKTYRAFHLYFLAFTGSVCLFTFGNTVSDGADALSAFLAILGGATCGWSWLLARALFRPPQAGDTLWPLAVVGLLIVTIAILEVAYLWSAADSGFVVAARNLNVMASSTVLLLALAETLHTPWRRLIRSEIHFRLAFAAGYAALLAVSVIWIRGAAEGSIGAVYGDTIRVTAASFGLLAGLAAVVYRHEHPIATAFRPTRDITDHDRDLAQRIHKAVVHEHGFAESELKVSILAKRLNTAEYKVTRAITGPMGFRNFNQMVNYHRIEHAKQMLTDISQADLSVLTIALDCGFASIGPFNRAFKLQVGTTPSAYRRAESVAPAEPSKPRRPVSA